jgi:hypothetical protein
MTVLRGKTELDPREKVEPKRGITQGLFIFLIEQIIQAPIHFHAARQLIGETRVDVHVGFVLEEAGKIEFAREGSIVGFDVKIRAVYHRV